MTKFRKRPIVIEAEQFFEDKFPLPFWDRGGGACCFDGDHWYVVTAHGQEAEIVDGDWIIPEPDNRGFYPCKPDIFEATYEPVEGGE